jgi:hypothetical protein
MNAQQFFTAGQKWLAPLLAVAVLAGLAQASDRLLVPEQVNLPHWQRGLGVSDDGVAVAVFYRPLADVPPDFDFHDFFDFGIDPSVPLLVHGFALLDEGALVPKQLELKNAAGSKVVLCFVDAAELLPIWTSGDPFTIGDLLAMDSLRIGEADFYQEVLHPDDPLDPNAPSLVEVVAKGVLEGGQSFFVATPNKTTIVRIGD